MVHAISVNISVDVFKVMLRNGGSKVFGFVTTGTNELVRVMFNTEVVVFIKTVYTQLKISKQISDIYR